jgi:hypothetical protein
MIKFGFRIATLCVCMRVYMYGLTLSTQKSIIRLSIHSTYKLLNSFFFLLLNLMIKFGFHMVSLWVYVHESLYVWIDTFNPKVYY